jgi:hypothetical protein
MNNNQIDKSQSNVVPPPPTVTTATTTPSSASTNNNFKFSFSEIVRSSASTKPQQVTTVASSSSTTTITTTTTAASIAPTIITNDTQSVQSQKQASSIIQPLIHSTQLSKIQHLTKLRDTLLPQLISGKIRLPKIEEINNKTKVNA